MTSVVYVVMEIGFDYDDNYYRSSNLDGEPINVFTSKDLAEKACFDKNVKALMNNASELEAFLSDGIEEREISAYEEAGFAVERGQWENHLAFDRDKELTKEQAEKLLPKINLKWFRVVEVDATVNHFYKNIERQSG